ncbi:hypothetical protein GCM10010339_90220 [Streptomyces alanosinicus]|uniref:Uncharacterized protein n=1 Tax=Streptomyces alanosinicus TaxID=68171 RepID=A0A918YST0_9ACTN|nr:hypothetical protein GCM10010339_90220 [Streptomyces alanosinicus]
MHHATQAVHLGHRLLERGQQHFDIAPVLVHGVEQPHPHAMSLQGPYGLYGPQALWLVRRVGDLGLWKLYVALTHPSSPMRLTP